jgi:hypothetical protein
MSPAELAAGYSAYTDADELRQEIERVNDYKLPTTTVLTTSHFC